MDSVDEAEIVTLVTRMPTAYEPEDVLSQLSDYLFEKYCVEGEERDLEDLILKGVGTNKRMEDYVE